MLHEPVEVDGLLQFGVLSQQVLDLLELRDFAGFVEGLDDALEDLQGVLLVTLHRLSPPLLHRRVAVRDGLIGLPALRPGKLLCRFYYRLPLGGFVRFINHRIDIRKLG